jgi:UDP-glucose 4-epimerase
VRSLITGGAGFIGSHLAEQLLRRGDDVCVVDDLSTGRLANLEHVSRDSRLRLVVGSCADRTIMDELISTCDRVFHLAAVVGVRLVVESPIRTIETNVHTTETVLALAARTRTPVLVASTSEVYGKSEATPFREDADLVLGPTTKRRWAYGCVKALAELHALAYWHEQRLPVVIARLFNTVGPRQTGRYGMVVPTFARQGLAGAPITIHGDGSQTRCFSHVKDVVDALVGLLGSERHFGETYNVGSTREIRIVELAKQVREMTGFRSELAFVPYDVAYGHDFEDLQRRVPDISKIEHALGWTPRTELQEILADVIAHVTAEA